MEWLEGGREEGREGGIEEEVMILGDHNMEWVPNKGPERSRLGLTS